MITNLESAQSVGRQSVRLTNFNDQIQLVAALNNGNPIAFNHLYRNYSAALMLEIMAIVRTTEQAEDVLQETFLKISKSLGQFDPLKGKFFTWMARIAKNNAIDSLRSKTEKHARLADELDNYIGMLDLNNYYLYHPEHLDLRSLTGRLNLKEQELIQLIYYKGFSHSEVAEFLNIPIGTVKSRWRQAIFNLRKIYSVKTA